MWVYSRRNAEGITFTTLFTASYVDVTKDTEYESRISNREYKASR